MSVARERKGGRSDACRTETKNARETHSCARERAGAWTNHERKNPPRFRRTWPSCTTLSRRTTLRSPWAARAPSLEAYLISRFTALSGTAMVLFGAMFMTCGRGARGGQRVRSTRRGNERATRGKEARACREADANLERHAHAERVVVTFVHHRGTSAVDLLAHAIPPVTHERVRRERHQVVLRGHSVGRTRETLRERARALLVPFGDATPGTGRT